MRPKWSEGVLTIPSFYIKRKSYSPYGVIVKSPMISISFLSAFCILFFDFTIMWSGLQLGNCVVFGMVYPVRCIYCVAHLLRCLFPTFHKSWYSAILLSSYHPSLKLKSPAMMLISISLLRPLIVLIWLILYFVELRLYRWTQFTPNLNDFLFTSSN